MLPATTGWLLRHCLASCLAADPSSMVAGTLLVACYSRTCHFDFALRGAVHFHSEPINSHHNSQLQPLKHLLCQSLALLPCKVEGALPATSLAMTTYGAIIVKMQLHPRTTAPWATNKVVNIML